MFFANKAPLAVMHNSWFKLGGVGYPGGRSSSLSLSLGSGVIGSYASALFAK